MLGGESTPALRRTAEYGNGWYGFNLSPDQAAQKIARLRDLIKENRRDPCEIEIIVSPYIQEVSPADLKRYERAGVDELALLMNVPDGSAEIAPRIEAMAREWVDPAAKL